MIHSSFSFGESTDWNVKQVREHLRISEDQFNILCSLPGWSKEKNNSNISRIDKDTTIGNSQSSQFQTCAAASQNSKIKQNLELFEKSLQYRRNILKSFQIDSKKFSRSSSLISIDKISENLSDDESLKRTLSVPVLYRTLGVSSTNSLSQESESVIALLKRHFHATGEKLPADKSIKNTILEKQKSENLPKPCSEIMEVVSQLPVNILSHVVEKVDIHEVTEKLSVNKPVENSTILSHDKSENAPQTSFEIKVMSQLSTVHSSPVKNPDDNKSEFQIIEKTVSDTVHITENLRKTNDDQPAIPANVTLSVNNSSFALHEKKCMLDKPCDSELFENKLNSCVVKETCSQANNTEDGKINLNAEKLPEISETPLENIITLEPATNVSVPVNNSSPFIEKAYQLDMGSESKENNFDSCIVKETCILATDTGDGKMNLNNEKLFEVGGTCSENSASLKPTPEKPSVSTNNLIFDIQKKKEDLQNVISEISSHKKASKQEIDCKTKVLEKRKLEFKSKISKKRKNTHEKQDHCDARSIKRAAEIYYSEDSFKSMINLLKGFF